MGNQYVNNFIKAEYITNVNKQDFMIKKFLEKNPNGSMSFYKNDNTKQFECNVTFGTNNKLYTYIVNYRNMLNVLLRVNAVDCEEIDYKDIVDRLLKVACLNINEIEEKAKTENLLNCMIFTHRTVEVENYCSSKDILLVYLPYEVNNFEDLKEAVYKARERLSKIKYVFQ